MLSFGITAFGGSSEPAGGLGEIARSTFALVIGTAEVPLSNRKPLLGRREKQVECPRDVFVNAIPMKVKVGKIVLSQSVSLESGLSIAFRSFGVIARDTATVLVEVAEKQLGAWIISRCGRAYPRQGDIVAGCKCIGLQKEIN